jgi:hypothetical protein
MYKLSNNTITNILQEIYSGFPNYKVKCVDGLINLTYHKTIQTIKNKINTEYLKYNDYKVIIEPENRLFINNQMAVCYLKFMELYFKFIIDKIKYLDSIPIVEQRSVEWFNQRNNLLSASSIYKVLGTDNDINTIVKEKIGIKKPFIQCEATIHGTVFEEVSQKLYELRNNIILKEYGCIPSNNYNYIGASPDGLVHDLHNIDMYNIDFDNLNDTLHPSIIIDTLSLFGKLLEIKNPYSRVITNKIPNHYDKQMILQEYVCGIPSCDYLEMNYDFYDSIDEFITDTFDFNKTISLSINEENLFIKNHNIPVSNLTKNGVEKGILLQFKKHNVSSNTFSGVLYNIEKLYTKYNIEKWIKDIIIQKETDGFIFDKQFLWSIKTYDIKEHKLNNEILNKILKKSNEVWDRILDERKLSDCEIIKKYKNLELINSNINDTINNKKRKLNSTYQERNIQNKSRKVIYSFG